MNAGEAIQHIVEQLIPLAVEGEFPEVAQIDFAACEDDGRTVMVYVHLADQDLNGGMPVAGTFDLEEMFREEFETAIFAAGAFHKALHGLDRHAPITRLLSEIEKEEGNAC
jgi:hypothetical protein